MSETQIPSLDELLERIGKFLDDPDVRQYQESFDVHFSLVASGQTRMLRDNNAMLAAQCVIVLIEHVRRLKKAEVTE